MGKLSLLNTLVGISLALGRVGREHTSLTAAATVGNAALVGGLAGSCC